MLYKGRSKEDGVSFSLHNKRVGDKEGLDCGVFVIQSDGTMPLEVRIYIIDGVLAD